MNNYKIYYSYLDEAMKDSLNNNNNNNNNTENRALSQ
jgi:hypothetical protein